MGFQVFTIPASGPADYNRAMLSGLGCPCENGGYAGLGAFGGCSCGKQCCTRPGTSDMRGLDGRHRRNKRRRKQALARAAMAARYSPPVVVVDQGPVLFRPSEDELFEATNDPTDQLVVPAPVTAPARLSGTRGVRREAFDERIVADRFARMHRAVGPYMGDAASTKALTYFLNQARLTAATPNGQVQANALLGQALTIYNTKLSDSERADYSDALETARVAVQGGSFDQGDRLVTSAQARNDALKNRNTINTRQAELDASRKQEGLSAWFQGFREGLPKLPSLEELSKQLNSATGIAKLVGGLLLLGATAYGVGKVYSSWKGGRR